MKYNRFQQGSATYTCRICKRVTRETGHDESSCDLCKHCYYESMLENAENDYGKDSPEYARALAAFEENKRA